MTRAVPEWIGKTDDTPVPDRVRLRVRLRDGNQCCKCTRPITSETAECDHIQAIINSGENRERNLHTLCLWCHDAKTVKDVAEKSRTYKRRVRHYGIRKPKHPIMGSKASGWRKRFDGRVERR